MKTGRRIPTTYVDTPMNATYSPEADLTEELNSGDVTLFQARLVEWIFHSRYVCFPSTR